MEKCPNTLCAYRSTAKEYCNLGLAGMLMENCICYQAFVRFSRTVDNKLCYDCASYKQWKEIKEGNLPRIKKLTVQQRLAVLLDHYGKICHISEPYWKEFIRELREITEQENK